jgi:hypothetical protein
MSVSVRAGLLSGLVLLSACDPVMRSGDANGGTVINAAGMEGRKAFALATAHCRQYGRQIKIPDSDMMNNVLTFDCVE